MVGTNRQSGGVSAEKGEKRVILGFTCNGLTRRIQRVENAVVAVRQDSNVDTVRMIFRPEEYNNINLASVSVKFLYVDTDGEIKAYQTGTTPDGGVYVADWELTDDVVDDAGYINFAVKLAVVNGDTVEKQWFSIPDTFRVYDSVDDTNNPPGETAAEQATNAEKIAQLQSQLGTATSELASLASTVDSHGAALDALNGATAQSRFVAADSAAADLTSIGLYYCGRWADSPAGAAATGYVVHMPHPTAGSPLRKQFYMPYATDVIYMRGSNTAGTFSEWKRLPTMEEMDAVTPSASTMQTATVDSDYIGTPYVNYVFVVGKAVFFNLYFPVLNDVQPSQAIITLPYITLYRADFTFIKTDGTPLADGYIAPGSNVIRPNGASIPKNASVKISGFYITR